MPGTPNKNDPNVPEWWNQRPSPQEKADHQNAVSAYLTAIFKAKHTNDTVSRFS